MFEGHVPAKYRHLAPRVETDERGFQQWWYGEKKGRNLGLNAVAGKPPEMYNVNPTSYSEMRPGCYDVHERVRDMSAGGTLAGPQLSQLDRVFGSGAERGSRPGGQRGDDQGLQRLACRRMVRQLSRPVHRMRHFAALRRAQGGRGGPSTGSQGMPRRHLLGKSIGAPHAVDPLGPLGSPLRRVLRRGNGPLPARRVFVQSRLDVGRCTSLRWHGPLLRHVRLFAG
jgi:hypothetical protein